MRFLEKTAAALVAAASLFAVTGGTAAAATPPADRIFVIMMENQGFDNVIGHNDANGVPDTPNITYYARTYNLATYSFGTTHPSLPNYIATVAGSYFYVNDDNDSCFAQPVTSTPCHSFDVVNLADTLEQHHISWVTYEQSMPSAGYLGSRWPLTGPKLYAQKHNPLVYFSDVARNANRLKHIVPMPSIPAFSALLNQPTYPRFSYIVPDQCHDMHGTTGCQGDALLREGDDYVEQVVSAIQHSHAYTQNSAIIITWDENDYSSNMALTGASIGGGGHIATIVITPRTGGKKSAIPYDQYSLLRTIEEAFGLPLLRSSAMANSLEALF